MSGTVGFSAYTYSTRRERDLLEQLGFTERLANKIVSADRYQVLAVLIHRTRRHGDDLGFHAAGHGPNPSDRLVAVHHRHAEIHQDQMRPPFLESLNGFRSIGRKPDLESDGG